MTAVQIILFIVLLPLHAALLLSFVALVVSCSIALLLSVGLLTTGLAAWALDALGAALSGEERADG